MLPGWGIRMAIGQIFRKIISIFLTCFRVLGFKNWTAPCTNGIQSASLEHVVDLMPDRTIEIIPRYIVGGPRPDPAARIMSAPEGDRSRRSDNYSILSPTPYHN